jgi:hypothetical protein
MGAIYFDSEAGDEQRRAEVYGGAIFAYSPRPSALELCVFARELLVEAFHPHPPELAQHALPVERYAQILAELKPRFIHHPECKRLIPRILAELGCDPERTYFDVPRLRSSTSDGYLTTGIAYAFHPHRDTWYSAPPCQVNWWMPVYPGARDNVMAFHPLYWERGVKNSSELYNYAQWNATSRFSAAQHIGRDTRVQPHALEPMELGSAVPVVTPVGGLIVFSAAQMHESIQNTSGRTRFSIDFRTVHLDDVEAGRGAPNVDSQCTGTTMGDYLRCTDLAHVPDELIRRYDSEPRA